VWHHAEAEAHQAAVALGQAQEGPVLLPVLAEVEEVADERLRRPGARGQAPPSVAEQLEDVQGKEADDEPPQALDDERGHLAATCCSIDRSIDRSQAK